MVVGPPIKCARNAIYLGRNSHQMGYAILNTMVKGKSTSCCFSLPHSCSIDNYARLSISDNSSHSGNMQNCFPKHKGVLQSFTMKGSLSARSSLKRHFNVSFPSQNMTVGVIVSNQGMNSKIKERAHAESSMGKKDAENDCASPHSKISHGKKVYTDYSVIGIPGDGRCLFRSVVQGACMRTGKPAPHESHQRELADELRSSVADEFIKRRQETEWFVEGDFDSYVAQIRKIHVWGGEPELLMASHVLRMPITVYMYDKGADGLISIAEYGQEYGKDNPIRVLYHGFGHYDSLQMPGKKGGASKL